MEIVKFQNVTLDYPIIGQSEKSLKKILLKSLVGGALNRVRNHISVRALDNISFEFCEGDRVGLVGNNGSGKSSVLNLINQTYLPTSGEVIVNGSVSSMLSISLGIDSEATGMENLILRCNLMRLNQRQKIRVVEDVVEFSELGDYINFPLRTYSSGMVMRLLFGIATSANSEIVIMDEWLSVGDEQFAKKAELRLQNLLKNTKLLVIASHNSSLIANTCNKVIHLDHGKIVNA